jgi:hypothetical protein
MDGRQQFVTRIPFIDSVTMVVTTINTTMKLPWKLNNYINPYWLGDHSYGINKRYPGYEMLTTIHVGISHKSIIKVYNTMYVFRVKYCKCKLCITQNLKIYVNTDHCRLY